MQVQSRAESFSIEEGVAMIAFDLTQSEVGYLIISSPSGRAGEHNFFGSDHHVEMKDESYGRYGGLRELKLLGDAGVQVGLSQAVPGVGESLTIIASAPMSDEMLAALRSLERPKT